MAVVFKNNAKTTLASNLSSSATSIAVADGSVFPSLGSGEIFFCTLDDGTNNEIVKVTAISSNTLTVVRAQESTTARAFSTGDAADLRLTAGILNLFTQTGVAITDEIESYLDANGLTFPDSVKAQFGAGNDLQIYHNGTDSYIQEAGTGNLNIKGNGSFINFLDNSNNLMAYMVPGGAVGLYHNTSKKFETTSGGVTVTGDITQAGGDYLYTGGGNFDIKHTVASQNITFHTTPSGGSATEVLRITHDGKLSKISGDLTVDVAGGIVLDADDSGTISFKDGGTRYGLVQKASNNFEIQSMISDGDLVIKGNDGGSTITALTLDMSDAGTAIFNHDIRLSSSGKLGIGINAAEMLDIKSASGDARIRLDAPASSDTEIKFYNDGVAQYTIGHDDATDNFVIGGANVDAPLLSVNKSGATTITQTGTTGSVPLSVTSNLHTGQSILELRTTGNANATIDLRADGTGDPRIFFDLNGATPFAIGVDNSDADKFKISGNYQLGTNDRLTIDSSGKTGIGTNSPDAKLRVDQDANSLAFKVTGGGSGVNIAEFTRDVGATASVNINASAGEPQIQFVDANTFAIGVNSNTFEIADNTHIGTNTRFSINNSGNATFSGDITSSGNLHAGDDTDISMDSSASGQLEVDGNGYQGAIALDGNAMHLYHNSSNRSLVLGTNETARLTIGGTGGFNFHSNNLTSVGTISASGNITSGNDVFVPNGRYFRFTGASSSSSGGFLFGDSSGTGGSIAFKRNSDSASVLTLNANQNASFSGGVTISGNIVNDIGNSGNDSYIEFKNTGYTGNVTSLRQNADSTRSELNSTERSIYIQAGSGGGVSGAEVRLYTNQSIGYKLDNSQNSTFYGTITGTTATASAGTNTTALASTAFVQQEITSLIGGAPGTLDTLNELAAAINDDSNYNSTLTTALATKLPLAGGTMTGALNMGSQHITNANDVGMATGHSSGKFAVKTTAVHNSYDFYVDGTSYFNGAVTVDDALNITGSNRALKIAGTTRINSVGDGLFTSLYIGSTNIVDTSKNLINIGTISSGNVTAGNSSTSAILRAHYSDGSYMTLEGYGLVMNRGASYIRPSSDGDKTLYVGGADASLDWESIHFRSVNGLYIGGTRFLDGSRNLSNIGTISAGRIVTSGLYGTGHSSSTLPIWQYNAGNTGYGIGYTEGSPDYIRFDVSGHLMSGEPDFKVSQNIAYVNGNQVWHAGNDGSGSGLDADTLDGLQVHNTQGSQNTANTILRTQNNGYAHLGWINTPSGVTTSTINKIYASNDDYIRYVTPATLISQLGLFTTSNDGSGSGLDADLLDGQHGSHYLNAANLTGTTPTGAPFLSNFVHIGNASGTGYSTDDGSWGTRLNVSASNHAKIEVSQTANSMRSHWYAHTGHDSIKFGTSTAHDVEFQRGGSTHLEIQSAAVNATNGFTVSSSNHTVWHAGNDGSGSGLDADLLDGLNSSSLLRSDADDAYDGTLTMNGMQFRSSNVNRNLKLQGTSGGTDCGISGFTSDGTHGYQLYGTNSGYYGFLDGNWANWDIQKIKSGTFKVDEGSGLQRVWNAGNDGSGSGLDADLLDGQHGSYYLPKSGGTMTGALKVGTKVYEDFESSGHFYLGNNDWGSLINNAGNGYSATHKGMSFNNESGSIPCLIPIDPEATYRVKIRFKQVSISSGTGKFYFGVKTLNENKTHLSSDQATSYNYGVVIGQSHSAGSTYTYEDTFSGYNATNAADHQKFDPEGKYFDLIWIANYTGGGEVVIQSIEVERLPDSVWVGDTEVISSSRNLTNIGNITITGGNTLSLFTSGGSERGFLKATDTNDQHLIIATSGGEDIAFKDGGVSGTTNMIVRGDGTLWLRDNNGFDADTVDSLHASSFIRLDNTSTQTLTGQVVLKAHANGWAGGLALVSSDGSDTFQIHPDNNGYMYVDKPWYFTSTPHIGSIGNTVWHTGNDGSGSGLDADTVDGQQPAQLSVNAANESHMVTGSAFSASSAPDSVLEYAQAASVTDTKLAPDSNWWNSIRMGHGDPYTYYSSTIAMQMTGTGYGQIKTQSIQNNTAVGWRTQWDSGNDGSGSGLDADLLDGQQGSYYAPIANPTFTGKTTTPRICVGADFGSSYPVSISTGQRYCIGFRNTGATNGSTNYPWLAHESNKLILHWNSIGDKFSIDHSGNVVASGNVSAYSDEKLKDNIEVIQNPIEKVKQIRGVTFTRNDLEDERTHTGVIAQEVEKVLPEVVQYDKDTDIKTVAYGNMVGLLVEAIKEQQEQIKEQQKQIDELKEKNDIIFKGE